MSGIRNVMNIIELYECVIYIYIYTVGRKQPALFKKQPIFDLKCLLLFTTYLVHTFLQC